MKDCFRDPIPELFDVARFLDAAVSAHILGQYDLAEAMLRAANMDVVRDYTESIWGAKSPYVIRQPSTSEPAAVEQSARVEQRMPNKAAMQQLIERDGYRCRFCGVPVIPVDVRIKLVELYPNAVQWGRKNIDQHAGLQALWLQYDHVVPHASGGTNDLSNLVITCAPCNYGKDSYCIEDLGLTDPRSRSPIPTPWDGLTRLLQ